MWPKAIAKTPISTIDMELNKNNIYRLWFSKLYKWDDHPLKVVIEPQRPTQKVNLYSFKISNELKNPNKKQPIKLTIKISSICHRNKAPGIAPKDIKKNALFLISLLIYWLPKKNPNAQAMIPILTEIINNFKALKNWNCKHKSYRS